MSEMQQYVRWQLSATIGTVRVSASCVTEERRDKTLKVWQSMRAKNITIVECPDAHALPTWSVRVPTNGGYQDLEFQASTKEIVKERLSDKKLKLKPWQVMTARIEQVA